MSTTMKWITGLAGVGLLAAFVVLFALALREAPLPVATSQQPEETGTDPTPTAAATQVPPTSALPNVTVVPTAAEGDDTIIALEETPTPFPTFTPRPTPTRKPGPTATPFPTKAPAADAAGHILYSVSQEGEQVTYKSIAVDAEGEKRAEPEPLSFPVEFTPYQVLPSPDGKYWLLMQPVEPGGIPYVYDVDIDQAWPLFQDIPNAVGLQFGWHPNSQQVLFWFFPNEELHLVDVTMGEYTTLAFTYGPPQGATISPEGSQIAYINRLDDTGNAVWTVSPAGSDANPLLQLNSTAGYLFEWSPDDQYILCLGCGSALEPIESAEQYKGPLWLIDPTGAVQNSLSGPFLAGRGFTPSWSPDGQWIAFTGLDEGNSFGCETENPNWATCQYEGTAIYVENVSTSELRRLSAGINPVWSPDGSILAFLSTESGAPEVWTIRLDGSEIRQVTNDNQPKHEILWIPEAR